MADNYLGKKMEDYMRGGSERKRATNSRNLMRLLEKNRSHREYDPAFKVREDQLRRIIEVVTKIPSARNQQVLRFRPVLEDEAAKVLPHIRLGGALPELHLPAEGSEPNAYIVICSTVPEDRYVSVDLGIAAQSMLLQAVEIGLNGICLMSFDKEKIVGNLSLPYEPLVVLAIGKSAEKIELVDIPACGDCNYYRKDGVHYVPKVVVDDLIIE